MGLKHRAEITGLSNQAVGERSIGVEGIPKGVLERMLVKMHGMSKR